MPDEHERILRELAEEQEPPYKVKFGEGTAPPPAPYTQPEVSAGARRTAAQFGELATSDVRMQQALASLPAPLRTVRVETPSDPRFYAEAVRTPRGFYSQAVRFRPGVEIDRALGVHEVGHLWHLQMEEQDKGFRSDMGDYWKEYKEDVGGEVEGWPSPRYQLNTQDDFTAERYRQALSLHASPNVERRDQILESLRKDDSASSRATIRVYDLLFGGD
jgi:hypothetical protein